MFIQFAACMIQLSVMHTKLLMRKGKTSEDILRSSFRMNNNLLFSFFLFFQDLTSWDVVTLALLTPQRRDMPKSVRYECDC